MEPQNPICRGKHGGFSIWRYNLGMHFAVIAMRVLEVMFFVGLAGSSVVVLISFFEDAKELFGED